MAKVTVTSSTLWVAGSSPARGTRPPLAQLAEQEIIVPVVIWFPPDKIFGVAKADEFLSPGALLVGEVFPPCKFSRGVYEQVLLLDDDSLRVVVPGDSFDVA